MCVKIRTVKNDIPKMQKTYAALNGKKIQVGVFGEQAYIAGVHEYGCNITVTDKMRGWLAANGLHLKKTTTAIHIPERSFLRAGHDENIDEVITKCEQLMKSLGNGAMSVDEFCNTIGLLLADKIKLYARELSTPPKHPFTLKLHPGKTNPLVNTGDMIGAINYRVE